MCLAVPGQVKEVYGEGLERLAKVDFQGSRVEVSLAMVPDAQLDAWVLVHAGYAIEVLDEREARETWDYLKTAGLYDEIPPALEPKP
ncbi:HypC/HybG/HupF family hydrogenase formation chaperone [Myxococcota bacterium]|nr:HypC/HybG/HupF family hydrogenase formation chaperone [Myxococcota bacterium]MBU1430703.1 HypC/HybG/HupF family hydrogenase formation chaperone [Myxococcota bacterium]MBU1896734.1 HypC/HybG/HupF family hydrogenase formation chaperone [Myxococcota bacterium]